MRSRSTATAAAVLMATMAMTMGGPAMPMPEPLDGLLRPREKRDRRMPLTWDEKEVLAGLSGKAKRRYVAELRAAYVKRGWKP